MRINNNMMAMNTHRQMGITNNSGAKSMEKLSSGFRINRAGDDAAGLSISEKMRGQIRGLNQASRNSQDGISMIQTAEGALTETHAILQRMRELGTQSANDTNVGIDREAIQNEMNQLSSEINRIGNTTEFNTQSLLKGDGKTNLTSTGIDTAKGTIGDTTSGVKGLTTHTQATQTVTFTAQTAGQLNNQTFKVELQGQTLSVKFVEDTTLPGATNDIKVDTDSVDSNSITIRIKGAGAAGTPENTISTAVADGLTEIIKNNDVLSGNFTATSATGAATLALTAQTKELGGELFGSNGYIGLTATQAAVGVAAQAVANVGTTTHQQATHILDFASVTTAALAEALIGTGLTIDGKQYEFYNADKGAYTGSANGINISGAFEPSATVANTVASAVAAQVSGDSFTAAAATTQVTFSATALGEEGNGTVKLSDGGVQQNFKSNFQVGANQGQSMTIEIGDMRSAALGITGKVGDEGFTAKNSVTNGTNNNSVEAALDVSTHESAAAAVTVINNAIEKVSAQRSELGSFQNRLEHTIKNLETSSENLQASESRIRDVDMAKEMMEFTKNNILQQAAQAMLAQANQAPQGVLQLLR